MNDVRGNTTRRAAGPKDRQECSPERQLPKGPKGRHVLATRLLALVCLALPSFRLASAEDQPVALDTIINAWKAREQKIQSFDFRWWSKHFQSEPNDWAPRGRGDVRPPPCPDSTFVLMYRFATDFKDGQIRTRLDDHGRQWWTVAETGKFFDRTRVELLDRGVEKQFFSNAPDGRPELITRSTPGVLDHHDIRSRAIRLAYRPLTGPIAVFPGQLKLVVDADKIADGTIALEFADAKVWVDPAKDFLPVRYTKGELKSLRSEMEIEYALDEKLGLVPQSWTSKQYDSTGKLYVSDTAKVLEYSVNKPLADPDFELDLPVGTRIYDQTSRKEFIVRAGGQRELVSAEPNGINAILLMPPVVEKQ
jgi:hypothetical protein